MRVAVFASVLLSTSLAFADIPPQGPAGECVVASQQRPGEQCQECAASYEAPDKCQTELGTRGFAKRCRGPGASVWHEVWCSGGGGAPPPAEKKGCAACAVGSEKQADWLALALSGLLAAGAFARRFSSSSRARTDR